MNNSRLKLKIGNTNHRFAAGKKQNVSTYFLHCEARLIELKLKICTLHLQILSQLKTNMGIVLFDWKIVTAKKMVVSNLLSTPYLFDGYLTACTNCRQFKAGSHLRNTREIEIKSILLLTEIFSHLTSKNFR